MKTIFFKKKKKINKEKLAQTLVFLAFVGTLFVICVISGMREINNIFGINRNIHPNMTIQYNLNDFRAEPISEDETQSAQTKLKESGLDIITEDGKLDITKISNSADTSTLKITSNLYLTGNELLYFYNLFYNSARYSTYLQLETRLPDFEYLNVKVVNDNLILYSNTPNEMLDNIVSCMPNHFVMWAYYYFDYDELDCDTFGFNNLDDEQNAQVQNHIGTINCFLCQAFNVYYMQEFLTNFANKFGATYDIADGFVVFAPIVEQAE